MLSIEIAGQAIEQWVATAATQSSSQPEQQHFSSVASLQMEATQLSCRLSTVQTLVVESGPPLEQTSWQSGTPQHWWPNGLQSPVQQLVGSLPQLSPTSPQPASLEQ
jgi:hypothetical protein